MISVYLFIMNDSLRYSYHVRLLSSFADASCVMETPFLNFLFDLLFVHVGRTNEMSEDDQLSYASASRGKISGYFALS